MHSFLCVSFDGCCSLLVQRIGCLARCQSERRVRDPSAPNEKAVWTPSSTGRNYFVFDATFVVVVLTEKIFFFSLQSSQPTVAAVVVGGYYYVHAYAYDVHHFDFVVRLDGLWKQKFLVVVKSFSFRWRRRTFIVCRITLSVHNTKWQLKKFLE